MFLRTDKIVSLLFGIKQVVAILLLAMVATLTADAPRPITVMIDAGHGGSDTGALGPNVAPKKKGAKPPDRLVEKDLTLQLAKLLGNQLKSQNYIVHYTRTTDVTVPLADRTRAANDVGADIFVSIHLNAFRNRSARGSEVFFLSLGPVDEELQALAEAENEPGTSNQDRGLEETDIVAGILEDLAQIAFLRESERMAVFIQAELNHLSGIKERGVKQAPFKVLRTAAMPAVLVEIAFISNPTESAKLHDPAFLKSAANAIAKGIQKYIESTGNSRTRRKAAT